MTKFKGNERTVIRLICHVGFVVSQQLNISVWGSTSQHKSFKESLWYFIATLKMKKQNKKKRRKIKFR